MGLDENVCLCRCCIYLHSAAARIQSIRIASRWQLLRSLSSTTVSRWEDFSNPEVHRSRCFHWFLLVAKLCGIISREDIYKLKTCGILRRKLRIVFLKLLPRDIFFRIHCHFCLVVRIYFKCFITIQIWVKGSKDENTKHGICSLIISSEKYWKCQMSHHKNCTCKSIHAVWNCMHF